MRTVYVFALIFLAASAMAEVNTKRAGLITKHIYSLIQTGYTVDTVVQLLTALLNVSQANLDELEENWESTKDALLTNIANIQALDDAQHQQCADIEATINDLKEEVRKYVAYIHDAQDTLEQNNENLASKLDARCSGNLLYVGHLKANQDSLRLLHFLRDQVSNPGFRDYLEGANDAFVELHHHLSNKKRSTLSVLAKHHMLAMITQAYTGDSDLHYSLSARSDSEIGSGHVDNDQSALSVDEFTIDARNLEDFIAELLGFVDDLIDQISEDSRQLQAAEFNAVEDLIDYEDQVEADAVVLNRYITLWVQHVEDLQVTIEQDGEAWEDCNTRAEELDDALETAEEDLAEREAAFEDRQESLQHTVDALQEIIDVYVNTVANAAIEYKAKFDHEMDQMAADRARHAAELEEEERAEVEAQEAVDRAAAYASAATASASSSSSSSESTGPVSAWISNQEVLEAEEAVAAAYAAEEEEESSSSSTETETETESSSTVESLITIAESSPTFATFSAPTTEWAPVETYPSATEESTETESESSSTVSEWTGATVSWSAAPSTDTYTESTETVDESYDTGAAWTLSVETESSESSSTEWEVSESSSSTEESTFNPQSWSYESLSESTETEEESSTAAFSAAVSAAASTVSESTESTEAVSDLFYAAVSAAASSVSESTGAQWGAAAPSSSESSSSESAAAWEWNAETEESASSSTESSSSEAAFFQKRGNLRRRV